MLVRSAFSANIKERRDCSTALFDERGRMIAQAEHIPVHLGAMPEAVAAVMRARPAAGRRLGAQRPVHGRDASPRHHARLAHLGRLRGHARAPRRRRRHGARQPARGLAELGRGSRDPADAADDDVDRAISSRTCATRTSGAATCARSSPRTGSPSGGVAELCERRGRDRSTRRWTSSTRTPSGASGRPSRASGRPLRGGRRARGHRGRARDARRRHDRGRRDRDRLRGHRAPARRQPQLPARRHALGVLLRRPLPDRPDIPASGGAFAPVDRRRARGLARQRPSPGAVVAGNVETSSRIIDAVLAAFGQAIPVPAQGQGTMNNSPSATSASRTTRLSAAARAPARTRTGPRPFTWRCRTR